MTLTEKPLVSVILATNRARPYLPDAIASVAAQTWRPIELIVVDDGSAEPDEVLRAAELMPGGRVIRQDASGVSVARNRGAAAASGRYLVFLDDDDLWAPERLTRHVEAMAAQPDAVASYCRMRTVLAATGEELAPGDQTPISGRLDVARRTTGILLPNMFIERNTFELCGGFDPDLRFAEDLDLALRLAEKGTFAFVPAVLVDYRATSDNATRRHRELVDGVRVVLARHRTHASDRADSALVGALDESIRKNERFAWWGAGRAAKAALKEKAPTRAVSELVWALRTAPRGLLDGVVRRITGSK
jgi:glycosyltransferase involved in cell wall biosynthesis